MTERLYYTSEATEGRAKVIRCTEEPDGRYAVELDQTLFHPQGGGQPADRGLIAGIAVEGEPARGASHSYSGSTACARRGGNAGR
jgi:Ser-tRNA(Ala) deacylase AlaX